MPFSIDDPEILRSIIMDNYQNPRNKEEVTDPRYITIHMDSASCIDDIYIHTLIENNEIKDCKWHGTGCAISSAATSVMTDMIIGKSVDEANVMMKEFNKMLAGEEYDPDILGDAIAFMNVNRQPSRITCANISWRGLDKAFKEEEKKHEQ